MTKEAVNWTDFVHTCDGDYVVYITDKRCVGHRSGGKLAIGQGSIVKCESDKSTTWAKLAKLAKLARSMLNPWEASKESKND